MEEADLRIPWCSDVDGVEAPMYLGVITKCELG